MIVAGPFYGEFGHELMRWQGHLRHLGVDKVFCEEGREYLYQDFAEPISARSVGGVRNRWKPVVEWSGTSGMFFALKVICAKKGEVVEEIKPCRAICEAKRLKQKFVQYGKKGAHPGYDVLIHARNIDKGVHRNWPNERWAALLIGLRDYRVAFVGTKAGARAWCGWGQSEIGVPLEKLCDIMANSKVIIGESSGPMHLASLCGLSHVVLTDRKKWNLGGQRGRNWTRYKRAWNPLGTKCTVIDECGYDPPVDRILKAVEGYL